MDFFLIGVAVLMLLDALAADPSGIPKFHTYHERWRDPAAIHFNMVIQGATSVFILCLVAARFIWEKR